MKPHDHLMICGIISSTLQTEKTTKQQLSQMNRLLKNSVRKLTMEDSAFPWGQDFSLVSDSVPVL